MARCERPKLHYLKYSGGTQLCYVSEVVPVVPVRDRRGRVVLMAEPALNPDCTDFLLLATFRMPPIISKHGIGPARLNGKSSGAKWMTLDYVVTEEGYVHLMKETEEGKTIWKPVSRDAVFGPALASDAYDHVKRYFENME